VPRADVFIDASNFTIACRQETGGRYVNMKALARLVAKKSEHALGAVFYYDSPSPTTHVQHGKQRFWQGLEDAGITVRKGRLESNYNGTHREKECDVMIAVDMVTRACDCLYDRAILISGDTDLAHAVEVVQLRGREVAWAYLPSQHHVDRLRQLIPEDMQIVLDEKTLRTIYTK
jgi:uncharacterized LabA/DUF88 family protein